MRLMLLAALCALATPTAVADDIELWPGAIYDTAIPTVESVLGYAPGERITTHADTRRYFDALAAAARAEGPTETGRADEGNPRQIRRSDNSNPARSGCNLDDTHLNRRETRSSQCLTRSGCLQGVAVAVSSHWSVRPSRCHLTRNSQTACADAVDVCDVAWV